MKRTLCIAVSSALLLASCGSSSEPAHAQAAMPEAAGEVAPPVAPKPAWTASRQTAWEELLEEARLNLDIPEGFHLEPGDDNIALPFEARLVSDDQRLEVRLSVRPLAELQLHFDDPHSAAPEPNHIFAMMFRAIVEELSPTGIGIESELSPKALEPYGASWGALVVLDLRPEVAPGHSEAILLSLHLEDASDAYALFLPTNLKEDGPLISKAVNCLRYVPLPAASKPATEAAE